MRWSEPNHVNIRLDISVPTGARISSYRGKDSSADDREGSHITPLFLFGGYPAGQANFSQNCDICVHPRTDCNLGTIAISFTYPASPKLTDVVAIVYPNALAHADQNPPLAITQRGNPSNNNTVWTWDGTNELMAADYTNVVQTRRNVIYLWVSADNGTTWTPDNKTFAFFGYAGTGGPCGAGSGSSSSSGGSITLAELAAHPTLAVVVPDGPSAGRYEAKGIATRTWSVTIGHATFELDMTEDGKAFVLRRPTAVAVSKSVALAPFSAVFPGSVVGAAGNVVVYRR